jgi:hypothetical protein
MSNIMAEGEELRRAIKWISSHLEDNPNEPILKLVEKAVFTFDLSPKDSEFLITFFRKRNGKA